MLKSILRRTLGAAALALFLCPAAVSAQQSQFLDRIIRGGEAPGLTGRSIDLSARATNRYAIVIGNGNYSDAPSLKNAVADARLVADFLKLQGYEVKEHYDTSKRDFEEILRRALFDISEDSEVVVYYAGHGFQIGSDNYIVPVDANFDTAYDVPFETVSLGSLVSIIGARARVQTVILDSCRDNPFAGSSAITRIGNELRESETGFATLAAPVNSLLVYSTSPGAVAYDGDGENSPFTSAFIEVAAEAPERSVNELFDQVRRLVYQRTEGRQVPWESSTLVESVSFHSEPVEITTPTDSGTDGGETRGLTPISANVLTATQISVNTEVDHVVGAALEREINLGTALTEALSPAPGDQFRVVAPPSNGRLAIGIPGSTQTRPAGGTLTADDLSNLVFISEFQQQSGSAYDGQPLLDTMQIEMGGQPKTIGLELRPFACDVEAGDYLDPDGTVFARFPNEIVPEDALNACQSDVGNYPENGRFRYQLGRALTSLRRFDEAQAEYERARDLGHVRAWNALGDAISDSVRETGGAAQIEASEEALAHYAAGVERGDPYAYYSLGRELMRHETDPERQIQGYDLMMRALEVGHTFAMNELGYFYLDSDSKYYEPERGLRYLRESAARDDIYGFNNMGLVYLNGMGGVTPDMAQAQEWFQKAADGGHPIAPANLGRMYMRGTAVEGTDLAKAVEWFDIGLARGDAWAGTNVGFLLANNEVPGLTRADGVLRAAKAAALRHPEAVAEARRLLDALPASDVDAGTQALMNELGADLVVDGAFGEQSQQMLNDMLSASGATPPEDRVERLVALARVFWESSPFRVDLY